MQSIIGCGRARYATTSSSVRIAGGGRGTARVNWQVLVLFELIRQFTVMNHDHDDATATLALTARGQRRLGVCDITTVLERTRCSVSITLFGYGSLSDSESPIMLPHDHDDMITANLQGPVAVAVAIRLRQYELESPMLHWNPWQDSAGASGCASD